MAEKLRTLRRRIRTVRNTEHITRAMQFVATAKLQKLQRLVMANQAYAEQLGALLDRVGQAAEVSHPYLEAREVKQVALVVMGGERGLCGAFNQQLMRAAEGVAEKLTAPILAVTVGARAERWARRRGLTVVQGYPAVGDLGRESPAAAIGRRVRGLYESGQVDAVHVVFEEFQSIMRHHPASRQLLPMGEGTGRGTLGAETYYEFQPEAEVLLGQLLPRAIDALLMYMALATHASEQAARMTAMSAATDNAKEMMTDLTRRLNRARQSMITGEILDVVGGANAIGSG